MEENTKKTTEQEEVEQQAPEQKETTKEASASGSKKKKSSSTKKKANTESKLQKELEECRIKQAEIQDRYLRLSAEYDNYRKRTLKEKMELTKSGGEKVLLNILPVVDNLNRAMSAMSEAKDVEAVKTGLELIINKFSEFMTQSGVKEIQALHEEFDTDLHEAITKIPAPEDELKGKIVDVIEKGYYLHDKVIRYAKVVVGE